MKIKCKIFGHTPDLIRLFDNKVASKIDDNCSTNCTRCNKIMTYDECWKKYSSKMIIILQNKLKDLLKNK